MFGSTGAVLSLGSTCLMEFSKPATGEHAPLLLSPRSLLVLTDEERYSAGGMPSGDAGAMTRRARIRHSVEPRSRLRREQLDGLGAHVGG